MNVIGLNDNNKLRSDYVYDTNQGKTQAEINSNQATVNANQATINNGKANVQTSNFSNVEFFRNITDSRYFNIGLDVADRSGLLANYNRLEFVLSTYQISIEAYNTTTNSWETLKALAW